MLVKQGLTGINIFEIEKESSQQLEEKKNFFFLHLCVRQ